MHLIFSCFTNTKWDVIESYSEGFTCPYFIEVCGMTRRNLSLAIEFACWGNVFWWKDTQIWEGTAACTCVRWYNAVFANHMMHIFVILGTRRYLCDIWWCQKNLFLRKLRDILRYLQILWGTVSFYIATKAVWYLKIWKNALLEDNVKCSVAQWDALWYWGIPAYSVIFANAMRHNLIFVNIRKHSLKQEDKEKVTLSNTTRYIVIISDIVRHIVVYVNAWNILRYSE
jgi:hypothetical protein